jgi:hypothetical protein
MNTSNANNSGQSDNDRELTSRLFYIGKDTQDHWVVQDSRGQYGGLFVSRSEALRFAMFENGHRPEAVMMVPGILELRIGRKPVVEPAQNGARRAA